MAVKEGVCRLPLLSWVGEQAAAGKYPVLFEMWQLTISGKQNDPTWALEEEVSLCNGSRASGED